VLKLLQLMHAVSTLQAGQQEPPGPPLGLVSEQEILDAREALQAKGHTFDAS